MILETKTRLVEPDITVVEISGRLNLGNPVLRRSFNMVRRTNADDGGHFVALEQPALFIDDVRTFFRAYR